MTSVRTSLRKLKTALSSVVEYRLDTPSGEILLNDWIGSQVTISFSGKINCTGCNKVIARSFNGYCYPCTQQLPETDMCQVRPELCHYHKGTCRDAQWGRRCCFTPHSVYLARSSAVKVGITRENPVAVRWMDQGAVEGMVIAAVPDRKSSGEMEAALAKLIEDKTDFRRMLRGEVATEDLEAVYQRIQPAVPEALRDCLCAKREKVQIRYPLAVPAPRIRSVDLDKQPSLCGELLGIKGQYLVFDDLVFNVRSHAGFEVDLSRKAVDTSAVKKTAVQPLAKPAEAAPNLFDLL